MIKISEWLGQYGSHDILDNAKARASFENKTGHTPPWYESHSTEEMQQMIDAKGGQGGELNVDNNNDTVQHISLLEIAEACTSKYVSRSWRHGCHGMGFAVRACIDAIAKKGY